VETKKPGFSSETSQAPPTKELEATISTRPYTSKTGFLSWARYSLAWRLAATYILATLFIVLILSAAVYLATALYLDERLKTELTSQADFYAAYAANVAPNEPALAGLAPTIVGLFAPQADLNVRFFAASNGALLAATQDIGPQPSRVALMELGYRSPTLFTQPSRDLPHRRYAARAITVDETSGQKTIGVIEVSRSTLSGERFLTTLRRILLGTLLVAPAMSLVVSALVARRLSKPIRHMEQATRRIAAGDLDVRLSDYPPDELGRLAESINYMAGRLKRLESARTQFISEVTHELRTPLTAIKGLLVNLIDAAGRGEHSSLEIADCETDRLIRLVNQLLDFSRWQAGRLELNRQPVEVQAMACTAVTLSEGRARHRGVTLRTDIQPGLPSVSADPDRLQQVILNLLDNAIKFTPSGGEISLSVMQKEDGTLSVSKGSTLSVSKGSVPNVPKGEIEISVQDTGRGMNDDEQERAFEAYYRGPGGGSGLGLTIARAIVDAHGGQMGIKSSLGQGCRVWFTLPL
jgi:signal transduction histidine kinase